MICCSIVICCQYCHQTLLPTQVSSLGDTDSAFSTEAEVCPSISSPSPQPVVNGYHEYEAIGENEESMTECELSKPVLLHHSSCDPSFHSSPLPRCVSVSIGYSVIVALTDLPIGYSVVRNSFNRSL